MERSAVETKLDWVVRIGVALILLQTLYFKFTGAEESVHIFTTMGIEPWGRYASGVAEGIAAILLLWPKKGLLPYGAGLAAGVIAGALLSHLTKLGIVVMNDGGLLFALACTVMVGCLWLLWASRDEIPFIGDFFRK